MVKTTIYQSNTLPLDVIRKGALINNQIVVYTV